MSESSATTSENHTFTTPPDYLNSTLLSSMRMLFFNMNKVQEMSLNFI